MVAEKFLSKIANWVPDDDKIAELSAKPYDLPELYSEPILLSEAILTKIFCGDPKIENYFGRLMWHSPTDIYDMIFRSWVLKYFNKPWEKKYKKILDKKIEKYILSKGLPGRFSRLDTMYAMYLSFAVDKDFKFKFDLKNEPSLISYYLIYLLNSKNKLDKNLLKKLKGFQRKNGGFPSSKLTTMRSNVYGTTRALVPLIVENYNSPIVKRALKFLYSIEPPYGYFKDDEPKLFVNLFVSFVIRLYEFFNESYKQEIIKIASKNNNELVNLTLYREFSNYISRFFELQREELVLKNSFGTKSEVRSRRDDIYLILLKEGGMDPASIIDKLKETYPEKYRHIKKRSHLTMIKLDLEFMRHLGVLSEANSKYFII